MLDALTPDARQVPAHAAPIAFPAGDAMLLGTLFLPEGPPRAALVLNPATGVPARFYRHFAQWLAQEQRVACLTYDYRGMGASRTGALRDCDATMSDWSLIDQPAARAALRRALPGVPLWVMGHSLGAMTLPMQDGIDDIARVFAVCSGYVRVGDHKWPYQALARLFWYGHAPVLAWALGYLPGRRLGFGEDLPPGVYWEWRRWCTAPDFFWSGIGRSLPAPDWGRSAAPVRLVALTDDDTIPPDCVWRLDRAYGADLTDHVTLDPRDLGLGKVGHLGAFARQNAAIWPALLGECALPPSGQGRG